MELQKLPLMATKEQLRLAELTQLGRDASSTTDEIASQKRVKKVVELTNCTASEAEVALIDCEGSVEAAVALLLDKPDKLVLWSQQGKTKKAKPTVATTNGPSKIGRKKEKEPQKPRFRKGEYKNSTASQNDNNYKSSATSQNDGNNDEWKSGPRVFMPSSLSMGINGTNTESEISGWPSMENTTSATVANPISEPIQPSQPKPKTFAAVAAMKKVQYKQQPVVTNEQLQLQPSTMNQSANEQQSVQTANEVKETDEAVNEWSSSVDWGTSNSPPPMQSPPPRQSESSIVAPPESFGASAQSLSVNQEYTDQLKNAIGLVQNNQASNGPTLSQIDMSMPVSTPMNYLQQQISNLPSSLAEDASELARKVEFATRDLPPPATNITNYQFGFQFGDKDGIPSVASLNDAWTNQHISSVELDRSMLKNSNANVLSTMTNIPTTSSAVTAHFSTASQQVQPQDYQRNTSSHSTALSFTDTASVNFPPANGGTALGAQNVSVTHPTPSTVISSNQQQIKPVYTNPSMVAAQQHVQQQQQPQTMYHQAPAPATVPQFPNYNMPYMYSPVAAAPTLPGAAEIDRLFLQYGGPYNSLDMQLGAMSLGPPTTLAPSHRTPLDSFMDNKFGQQQQSVNQGSVGGFQHNQSTQQQRGHGQSDTAAAILGGGTHVAPPPGFGMPTAPAQPTYMPQPANLQSLFQMPTYHPSMSYQQHQFMLSNANRFPTSQRPTQTSPPEGNGPQQRRHDIRGGDGQGYPGSDSVEHSTGSGPGPQSYVNFNKYRSYM